MTKFGGDGKAKQACEGRKCKKIETKEEDTEIHILPPPNTNSKEKKETKKTHKKAGNSTASIKFETQNKKHNKANANHAKQMAEIKNKTKDHEPPGATPANRPNPMLLHDGGEEEGHGTSRRHQELQPRGDLESRAKLSVRDLE